MTLPFPSGSPKLSPHLNKNNQWNKMKRENVIDSNAYLRHLLQTPTTLLLVFSLHTTFVRQQMRNSSPTSFLMTRLIFISLTQRKLMMIVTSLMMNNQNQIIQNPQQQQHQLFNSSTSQLGNHQHHRDNIRTGSFTSNDSTTSHNNNSNYDDNDDEEQRGSRTFGDDEKSNQRLFSPTKSHGHVLVRQRSSFVRD